ncbi:MAG: ribose 5-phosphate isomerase B [Tannerella sp.]|jgi:ribose 5-phosphate isomerase B|nr:ribose 5-phosphate isomerase B [Tannerella sp.]
MCTTIGFASDHAGFELKEYIKGYMEAKGFICKDFGTYSSESCDYPDYAHLLAEAVEAEDVDCGIALCGSGNGISMALNKHQGIRAAICWNVEISHLTRLHNDANILVLPARFIGRKEAEEITDMFFKTSFDGGRHQLRIEKIPVKARD